MIRGLDLRNGERGATVVEFAIASGVFFMLIFGIIEFGRLLYTHNALTDAARRGARYAAINTENETCVKNVVIYGERSNQIGPRPSCAPIGPPLVYGLDQADIDVHYEGVDLDGDEDDPTPIDTNYGMNLGTATIRIQNFAFSLNVPFANRDLILPEYTTTLTAESAGEEPDDIPVTP